MEMHLKLSNYPMSNMESEYKQLGKARMPKLMIWGAKDAVCPIAGAATITRLVSGIQLFKIDDGKHEIAYSHADMVNGELKHVLPIENLQKIKLNQ